MIDVRGLRKEYRGLVALRGLDLRLEEGEIFGFIGPNGAGKTTTIRILATLLAPTAGSARVGGYDVVARPEAVRELVGYMPDTFGVYDEVKVWEYLDFFAAAYRIPRARRPGVIEDVLQLTDLGAKRDAYVETLARGMKQRLCLAKTLVHDPKVLLLDEPASGLDPRARAELKELLRELQRMGKTILVSSHILPELADFCSTIGILEQGEMLLCGPVDEVLRQAGGHRALSIRVAPADAESALRLLAACPGVTGVRAEAGALVAAYAGDPEAVHEVLAALVAGGVRVLAFSESLSDLESLFLRVTRGAAA